MPYITIDTNAKIKVQPEMLENLTDLVAVTLGKPKKYIISKINTGKDMMFGDDMSNIGALIEMKSIGFGGKEDILAQKLTDFAKDNFRADQEYVGIQLQDMPAHNVACGGKLLG